MATLVVPKLGRFHLVCLYQFHQLIKMEKLVADLAASMAKDFCLAGAVRSMDSLCSRSFGLRCESLAEYMQELLDMQLSRLALSLP